MWHLLVYRRKLVAMLGVAAAVAMAGCSTTPPPAPKPVVRAPSHAAVQCRRAQPNDPFIGNWLGVHKQRGVAGELHSLFTLKADGTMAYSEQLRRGRKPSQGLYETGCWRHEGSSLLLQTTKSNGVSVEPSDPIYSNTYRVISRSGKSLTLRGADGRLNVRRMPDGYRLPY